ncbi:hypothetical protein F4678DRAFT_435836 [Xylaria arbuscula]|nr:hypothetical protein F4678DRAFT_435836 [Xylaria arbuscula]
MSEQAEITPSALEAGHAETGQTGTGQTGTGQTESKRTRWWDDAGHDPWEGLGGIPRTAKFLNADRDMTMVVFRRFRELSIRNLLNLEARVAALQAFQQNLDNRHRNTLHDDHSVFHDNDIVLEAERSWETFAVLGLGPEPDPKPRIPRHGIPVEVLESWCQSRKDRDGDNTKEIGGSVKQTRVGKSDTTNISEDGKTKEANLKLVQLKWDVALAIQEAVKDYQDAVIRYHTILKLEPPAERTWEKLQDWFNGPPAVFLHLSAMKWVFHKSGGKKPGVSRHDAMSIHASADNDPVSKVVSGWTWLTYSGARMIFNDQRFSWTSEKYIHGVVTFITLAIAMVLLIGAVWSLWASEDDNHFTLRLGVLTTWVILFSLWITLATGARSGQVFAATAAYAAVLVVFVGKG